MKNVTLKSNKVINFVLDLIFPRDCISCGREGRYLCAECLEKIPINNRPSCALCHGYSPAGWICPVCQKDTALKAIWVTADYNNKIVQDLIHNFKYNYLEELGVVLADVMLEYWKINKIKEMFSLTNEDTLFIPVPLHRKRYLSRGFNQSEILAKRLSQSSQIKTANLLVRQKNTQTQINLPRRLRQLNVAAAFTLNSAVPLPDKNKKIVIIDDVITTGSTLKECAQVLAKAGYRDIYGFVIAQKEDK